MVEAARAEAHYRLGDLKRTRDCGESALFHFGQYVPTGRWGWLVGTLQQAGLRSLQATLRVRSRDLERARRVAREVAPLQIRMSETFMYSLQTLPLVWSSLRTVNQCEPAGPSPHLAQGYLMIGLMAPVSRFADAWCRRALEIAEQTGTRRDVALVLSRIGVNHTSACRWDEAEGEVRRATRIAEEIGDLRLLAECSAQIGAVAFYSGTFERGHGQFREVQRLCVRSGNKQGECWGLLGEADCLVRMGRDEEALGLYEQAIGQLDEQADRSEVIWGLGMQALARLRVGDRRGAYESAEGVLSLILETRPVVYWLQHPTAATAEVFLSLLESKWGGGGDFQRRLAIRAKQACAAIRRYARRFPLGRPHALLWQGLNARLAGRRGPAMRLWRKSLGLAEALHTPYEQGRAHLEIGRHLAPEDERRRHHLNRAAEVFEKLGCARDLARTRRELGATP
jgi:tetratricopeptide (TPR) repeat protein